jgi:parallel beta-helix repeat protein
MMKRKIVLIWVTTFCFFTLLVPPGNSVVKGDSAIFYVGGTGTGNYSNIQSAIDDARDGDTIYVFTGVYYENLVIDKSVDLIGENRDTTFIDGGKKDNVITVTADRVNISGFCIRNSGLRDSEFNLSHFSLKYNVYTGVFIGANSVNISNCRIESCYYAVLLEKSSYTNVKNSRIINNCVGIVIRNSSYNYISNCTFLSTEVPPGISNLSGICLLHSHNNTISNCNISSSEFHGTWLSASCYNQIYRNTFWNNGNGVFIPRPVKNGKNESKKNVFFENNFIKNKRKNAYDDCNNSWDNGVLGNYWDDYKGADENNDTIGDVPHGIPGKAFNRDWYPLVNPVPIEVTPYKLPVVNIVFPLNNSKVSGVIIINGTAYSEEGDIQSVKIRIDDEEWRVANGTANWRLEWNTTKYEKGSHTIYVYVQDEKGYSRLVHVIVNVDTEDGVVIDERDDGVPGFTFLFVVVVFLLVVLWRRHR